MSWDVDVWYNVSNTYSCTSPKIRHPQKKNSNLTLKLNLLFCLWKFCVQISEMPFLCEIECKWIPAEVETKIRNVGFLRNNKGSGSQYVMVQATTEDGFVALNTKKRGFKDKMANFLNSVDYNKYGFQKLTVGSETECQKTVRDELMGFTYKLYCSNSFWMNLGTRLSLWKIGW